MNTFLFSFLGGETRSERREKKCRLPHCSFTTFSIIFLVFGLSFALDSSWCYSTQLFPLSLSPFPFHILFHLKCPFPPSLLFFAVIVMFLPLNFSSVDLWSLSRFPLSSTVRFPPSLSSGFDSQGKGSPLLSLSFLTSGIRSPHVILLTLSH